MRSYLSGGIVRMFNAVVLVSIFLCMGSFTLLIGSYVYQTSTKELEKKTSNTLDLAAISLMLPLWNLDDVGLTNIFKAIFLDSDVLAIRVTQEDGRAITAERVRENLLNDGESDHEAFERLKSDVFNIAKTVNIYKDTSDTKNKEPIGQVQIITSSQKVKESIRNTTVLISGFALVFAAIVSLIIGMLGTRIIQRPIHALRASSDILASGNLDQEINTDRNDELGSLAKSFDTMRNAIRKKLDDLAKLNETGESLAGIHDQGDAIELAMRVMRDQTGAEKSSTILLEDRALPENLSPEIQKACSLGEVAIISKLKTTTMVIPMMDDKTIFGFMELTGEKDHCTFTKEDQGFALTVGRMTVTTIKNIRMLKVIEHHNRTLEEKILERTAQLRQKTNDINSMLQNMRQGIFTIVSGNSIHPEYSAYLKEIFETEEIASTSVLTFLFDDSDVGSDAKSQMEAALDSMLDEDSMMFEFNSHLLTTHYTKFFARNRSKSLELDWNPVLNPNGQIEKLMVTVRDVTELRILQSKAEEQKVELDIIGQILALSKEKLVEFVEGAYAFLNENRTLIEKNSVKNLEIIATLFRNIHTIKGNARTYGLTYITDRAHEAETTYNQMRSDNRMGWNQELLLKELQSLKDCVARYEHIFKDKLTLFAGSDGEINTHTVIESISQSIDQVNEQSPLTVLQSTLHQVRDSINLVKSDCLSDILKGIIAGLPSIAKQLKKDVPEVTIQDNSIRLKKEITAMLKNVFMHAFRNSMDHGFESTSGKIRITLDLDEDQLKFTFSDSGRGLALKLIKMKAISLGLITSTKTLSDEEIANLIFIPGVSTAVQITNVSGRGVGMDAIKKFLNSYKGDAKIQFSGSPNSEGYQPFKLVMTLPPKYAYRVE